MSSASNFHSGAPAQPSFLTDNYQKWTAMFLGHLTASLGTDINPNGTHGVAQAGASDDPLPSAPRFVHPTGSGAIFGPQNKNPMANTYWTGILAFPICMLQVL